MHDELPVDAVAAVHEVFLRRRRVHQQHVGIAARAHGERFATADGDDLDVVVALFLERGLERIEQAAVLRARRRREDDVVTAAAARIRKQ